MSEGILTILKFCFLALLYLFLFRVVRLIVREMLEPKPAAEVTAPAAPAAAPTRAASARRRSSNRSAGVKLRLLEPADRQGEIYPLDEEVTVGRGAGLRVVLDRRHASSRRCTRGSSGAAAIPTSRTSAPPTARS